MIALAELIFINVIINPGLKEAGAAYLVKSFPPHLPIISVSYQFLYSVILQLVLQLGHQSSLLLTTNMIALHISQLIIFYQPVKMALCGKKLRRGEVRFGK